MSRSKLIKFLSVSILLGGVCWVLLLSVDSWKEFAEVASSCDFYYLAIVIVLGLVANYISTFIFKTLVECEEKRYVSLFDASYLLYVGYMLRHLPGRVWGVVYHATIAHTFDLKSQGLIKANIVFTLTTLLLTASIPLGVVIASYHVSLGLVFVALASGFFFLLLSSPIISAKVKQLLLIFIPVSYKVKFDDLFTFKAIPFKQALLILMAGLLSWMIYLLAWFFLPYAWPEIGGMDGLLAGAHYSISWLVGYLSFLTPSGIGAREGSYVLLTMGSESQGGSGAVLVLMFARLWLVFNDVVLFTLFLVLRTIRDMAKKI